MDGSMLMPFITTMFMSQNDKNAYQVVMMMVVNLIILNYSVIYKFMKAKIKFHSKKTQFSMKANVTYHNNCLWSTNYPVNFIAVLSVVRHMLMENTKFIDYEIKEYLSCSKKDTIMFVELHSPYMATDKISVTTNISTSDSDKGNYTYTVLEIVLSTKDVHNFKVIEEFIGFCMKHYNYELLETVKTQHVFMFESIDDDSKKPFYQEFPFETTKTFSNLFFGNKQKTLNTVDNFMENKSEYVRLGIPYTLGFLLYGESGCGKSSFCKALANYTKRHVVILPTNKIKNVETLRSIFLNTDMNSFHIPNRKRLYIIEDVDCSCWHSILLNRENLPAYKIEKPDDKETLIIDMIQKIKTSEEGEDSSFPRKKKSEDTKMVLTLSDILEILDGIIEIDGRMIVMTTNHVDILDPALIRPGRFDVKIEFTKLSRENIVEIFNTWFPNKELPAYIYNNITDYHFTQAQIGKLFSTRDFDEIFKTLVL